MVRPGQVANARGKTRFGCLLALLLAAAVGYYSVGIGSSYVRYWRMRDAMQSEARFAPNISDEVIRRRLSTVAQELGLPAEAQRFRIRRFARPREIVITTSWQDTLNLPFIARPITRRPEVRAQL